MALDTGWWSPTLERLVVLRWWYTIAYIHRSIHLHRNRSLPWWGWQRLEYKLMSRTCRCRQPQWLLRSVNYSRAHPEDSGNLLFAFRSCSVHVTFAWPNTPKEKRACNCNTVVCTQQNSHQTVVCNNISCVDTTVYTEVLLFLAQTWILPGA